MALSRKIIPPRFSPEILVPGKVFVGRGFAITYAEAHERAEGLRDLFQSASANAPSGDGRALGVKGSGTGGASPESATKSQVLLGGAGFLGSRIAAALLLDAGTGVSGDVVIISRKPGGIRTQWAAFLGDERAGQLMAHPRLRLISADMSSSDLSWMKSVPTCSVVYHLAAQVHAFASYERLIGANVTSMIPGLVLALRDDALLQHAGTLSVFVSSNCREEAVEASLCADEGSWLYGGYAQTKAVAEIALERLAGGANLRWQNIRFGLLVPEPAVPFPADSFFRSIIHGLDTVGCVPGLIEESFVDLTPVSSAAGAAIRLAAAGLSKPSALGIFHLANRQGAALSDFLDGVDGARARMDLAPLRCVDEARWKDAIAVLPRLQRLLLLSCFKKAEFISTEATRSPVLNADLFQSTGRSYPSVRVPDSGIDPISSPKLLLPGIINSARLK